MNELSRHIEILLLDNDCVIVPGFGGFMAHHRPAEYVEEAGMFYPPQRTLGFNPQLKINDSLLAQSYVEAYDISYPEAVLRIESEVEEISQILGVEGAYEFYGIGTITLSADGKYDFMPCAAGLLTPMLYALNSFTLDSLTETPAVIDVAESESKMLGTVVEDSREDVQEETDEHDAHVIHISLSTLRNISVAAMILLLFVFSSIPAGVGSNKVITCSILDTELFTSFVKDAESLKALQNYFNPVAAVSVAKDTVAEDTVKAKQTVQVVEKSVPKERYVIVLASMVSKNGAKEFMARLEKDGYAESHLYERGSVRKVFYGDYATTTEAHNALAILRGKDSRFSEAWISKN